ncbi:LuxR C-terminal-related transcriptional regulator [Mycolicibacterium sp. XJ2]
MVSVCCRPRTERRIGARLRDVDRTARRRRSRRVRRPARRRARRHRADPPRRPRRCPHPPTGAPGELFLSAKTVEATLARVYRKLNIRSRAELTRVMSQSGR